MKIPQTTDSISYAVADTKDFEYLPQLGLFMYEAYLDLHTLMYKDFF